jgi:4'-phosphopantetheinyl transferase
MPGSVNNTFNNNVLWQASLFPVPVPQCGTIYIWHGITAELLHLYTNCYLLLNGAEQNRAERYFRLADRQRYVIQHGLLRLLLGWYLKTTVFDGIYTQGGHGKPYLPNYDIHPGFFNLSNSAGEFLIAIGDTELGVDIEYLKPWFAWQDIASRYFGANELDYIAGSENPVEAFFLLWTRKEALLKATGEGIDDDLLQIPALNGQHALPVNYNNTHWLTASFKAESNSIMSVAYRYPISLQLIHLEAGMVLQGINEVG